MFRLHIKFIPRVNILFFQSIRLHHHWRTSSSYLNLISGEILSDLSCKYEIIWYIFAESIITFWWLLNCLQRCWRTRAQQSAQIFKQSEAGLWVWVIFSLEKEHRKLVIKVRQEITLNNLFSRLTICFYVGELARTATCGDRWRGRNKVLEEFWEYSISSSDH